MADPFIDDIETVIIRATQAQQGSPTTTPRETMLLEALDFIRSTLQSALDDYHRRRPSTDRRG